MKPIKAAHAVTSFNVTWKLVSGQGGHRLAPCRAKGSSFIAVSGKASKCSYRSLPVASAGQVLVSIVARCAVRIMPKRAPRHTMAAAVRTRPAKPDKASRLTGMPSIRIGRRCRSCVPDGSMLGRASPTF